MSSLVLLKCGVDSFLIYYLFIKRKRVSWLSEKYQRRILYFLLIGSVFSGLWIYESSLIVLVLQFIKFVLSILF